MMKPLLPGAIELPNDKYRFRIAELEEKVSQFTELEQKVSQYADENRKYASDLLRYISENEELKKRIAELEAKQSTQ